MSKKNHLKRA